MTYNVLAVANAFIKLSLEEDISVTNMKLQKLVYIGQGFSFGLIGEPLFKDDIRALKWGPVIMSLYNNVKRYGSNRIDELIPLPKEVEEINLDNDNDVAVLIIKKVWQKYKNYTAAQLSTITHKLGTPWSDVWADSEYDVIPKNTIESYYKTFLKNAA